MNDLIDRQDVLNALGERPIVWTDNDDYTLGELNQYDSDRLAIETVPSAERSDEMRLSKGDFGTLCICALRYCFGRQTYMPSLVQGICGAHLKELSDKDILVIADDCEFQERMHLYGDEVIDKPGWLAWRDKVFAEKKRRGLK